jgi:hypothetical protein
VLTTSLRYSLEIVECGGGAGSDGRARFPETGDIDLGVDRAGGLKVTIIPIQVDDFLPDTSAAGLAAYVGQMMAMYPIDNLVLTVGDTLTTTAPVDWETMLEAVRNKRAADAPSPDEYYFGLVKPAASLRAYCLLGCTLGLGYVVTNNYSSAALRRVAVGVGFGDRNSTESMAHELGHNHGREHAPCVTEGGEIVGVDPDFPYSNGGIGVWGYDRRTQSLVDPGQASDLMGYCNNKWISDYTYAGLTERIRLVNSAAMIHTSQAALGRWWIMDIDSKGARFGLVLEQEAVGEGEPEQALVYGVGGQVLTSVTVYRSMMSNGRGSMVMVPAPSPGWDAIVVAGAPPLSFAAPPSIRK